MLNVYSIEYIKKTIYIQIKGGRDFVKVYVGNFIPGKQIKMVWIEVP